MNVYKNEEVNPFRISIKEIICGFAFHEIHMPNSETVGEYEDELKNRVYIKAFKCFYGLELSEDQVRWWIESKLCS